MAELEQQSASRKCAQCGAVLPAHVPDELCPKCLLQAALGTLTVRGPTGTIGLVFAEAKSRGLPQPGETLGHYRIIRLLGQGGMGAAFEAEDLESGRRVALKVLSHTLDSPEARERFFREGRLAASINHPNSVYVFGTEEIGGTPVIAMELVSGGTLQDRVQVQGPLPVGEAVDAVLQIIAGLEAAQRIGILHRDVKPSNCFRDADGAVKIGDFGLSISTAIRTEPALTSAGAFLGTPAYCSPEQLRGDELNARSDMYSVGATLFYLLTGRTPFEAKDTVRLLATVLEQRAPSPRKLRPSIPKGLAKVVLRCLEKQPGDRFRNYSELAQALAPYGSAAPTPATLGLRFLAGALDQLILGAFSFIFVLLGTGDFMGFMDSAIQRSPGMSLLMLGGFAAGVAYFAIMEGIWGFTLGKVVCRLRVVGPDNSPPGWRALGRAFLYVVLPPLPYLIASGGDPKAFLSGPQFVQHFMSVVFFFVVLLLFSTARRRNGFAAVHDLLTRTRVIARVALHSRPVLAVSETPPPELQRQRLVGPYHILESLASSADVEWLLGYDLKLLRKVWLRVVPPGTPALPPALRNVSRIGRLRWLTGRRSTEENWDAFEASPGKPFLRLTETPQPWSQVRFWLFDLAQEIGVARKEGTLPEVLSLDRVWITSDGRAKLLDFPAPGSPTETTPEMDSQQPTNDLQFLNEIAQAALAGRTNTDTRPVVATALRLPLHAREFLDKLPALPDAQSVARALQTLLHRLAEVTRLRRAAIVAASLAFPVLAVCSMLAGTAMLERWDARNPGLLELNMLLHQRDGMKSRWVKSQPHPTDRQFALFIAQHYASTITNESRWTSLFALSLIQGERRRFAERCISEPSAATQQEIAAAEAALQPYRDSAKAMTFVRQPWFAPMMLVATLAIYVGFPAIIAALAFRGGLILLLAGVTFVRRDGARASRLRVFWRSVVTWSPLLAVPFLFAFLRQPLGPIAAGVFPALLLFALVSLSIALPHRGLADRLAGTWPVPR